MGTELAMNRVIQYYYYMMETRLLVKRCGNGIILPGAWCSGGWGAPLLIMVESNIVLFKPFVRGWLVCLTNKHAWQ